MGENKLISCIGEPQRDEAQRVRQLRPICHSELRRRGGAKGLERKISHRKIREVNAQ